MKRLTLTLVGVLLCAATTTIFNSCNQEKDLAITYGLFYDKLTTYSTGIGNELNYFHTVDSIYCAELGIPKGGSYVTLNGKQSACDQQIIDACLRAEEKAKLVPDGTVEVCVKNTYSGVYVYSKQIP